MSPSDSIALLCFVFIAFRSEAIVFIFKFIQQQTSHHRQAYTLPCLMGGVTSYDSVDTIKGSDAALDTTVQLSPSGCTAGCLDRSIDMVFHWEQPTTPPPLAHLCLWHPLYGSGGEQQRLAFARLLYQQPMFALLDESTSAMDIKLEKHCMEMVQAAGITCVSVGHRPSLLSFHTACLTLSVDGSGAVYVPANIASDRS